jgi:hypothetical protein
MRKKIFKWCYAGGEITDSSNAYFFDLYLVGSGINKHYIGLNSAKRKMCIEVYPYEDQRIKPIDEKEVPERYRKIVKDFMEDPFFEIELEKFICQKNF